MIVLSDYLFIFALSKSWKSVRNSLKNDWKNVYNRLFFTLEKCNLTVQVYD